MTPCRSRCGRSMPGATSDLACPFPGRTTKSAAPMPRAPSPGRSTWWPTVGARRPTTASTDAHSRRSSWTALASPTGRRSRGPLFHDLDLGSPDGSITGGVPFLTTAGLRDVLRHAHIGEGGLSRRDVLSEELEGLLDKDLDTWISRFREREAGNPVAFLDLLSALGRGRWRGRVAELRTTLEGSGGPLEVWCRLEEQAKEGRWPQVVSYLEALPESSRCGETEHLLALALMGTERVEEGLEILLGFDEDRTDIENPRALGQALACAPGTEPDTPLGRLVQAVREADRAFAAGDPRHVVEVLDGPALWEFPDRQVTARRAAAWLDLAHEAHPPRFQANLAMARLDGLSRVRFSVLSLPMGPQSWSSERLVAVTERARSWLEESGGSAGGSPG